MLGGGLMTLWKTMDPAPSSQPQAGVAAHASDETTQAIKDLQTTEQRILASFSQSNRHSPPSRPRPNDCPTSYRIER